MKPDIRFHLYDADGGAAVAIGPGKIALLEAVAATGSISAAARALGMSYRRAWMLVDETNRSLAAPAVEALTGGTHGGGAALTPLGNELVSRYRDLEQGLRQEVDAALAPLMGSVAGRKRRGRT